MYIYRKGTEIVLNSFDSNWAMAEYWFNSNEGERLQQCISADKPGKKIGEKAEL